MIDTFEKECRRKSSIQANWAGINLALAIANGVMAFLLFTDSHPYAGALCVLMMFLAGGSFVFRMNKSNRLHRLAEREAAWRKKTILR